MLDLVGVAAFLGIPYAAPPFGARRMRPPEPPVGWEGERGATDYGPTCPKDNDDPEGAALRRGAASGVRLLAGWNRDDTRIGLVPTGMIDLADERILSAVVGAYGGPDGTIELYRAARPGANDGDLLAAVTTDCFIRVPVIRVAEARR
ncbi:carboxylesterase family protein [Nonomuraea sp. NPDC052129]|uniref:carboxylesterase family protein n=1 Tax=Nonomuraea sp. NPDC052129 TaxID=3154651 RepID=UPI0034301EC3